MVWLFQAWDQIVEERKQSESMRAEREKIQLPHLKYKTKSILYFLSLGVHSRCHPREGSGLNWRRKQIALSAMYRWARRREKRWFFSLKTLFTFTSLSLGFVVIFKENQHFRSFSSGIMTWYNLNHLLLKEGLGFRKLYLIEFPWKSTESWSRIHYMLKGCQLRAFPSHFVKFLYFTSSKCYFSTLTNHFYNTTHIPLLILLLL